MESQPLDLHQKIDGVTRHLVIGPSPEIAFYDEAGQRGWMFRVRHDAEIVVFQGGGADTHGWSE